MYTSRYTFFLFIFTIPVFAENDSDEDVDSRAVRRFSPDHERTIEVAQQTLRAMDKSIGREKCPRTIKEIKSFLLILAGALRYNTTFQICNNRTTCQSNNKECQQFCTPEELKPDPPIYSSCMFCEVRSTQLRPETQMLVRTENCIPIKILKTTPKPHKVNLVHKKVSETKKQSSVVIKTEKPSSNKPKLIDTLLVVSAVSERPITEKSPLNRTLSEKPSEKSSNF